MNNFPYIDIFILAMIAVFIINRLRNVLGKKTGNESDIVEKFTQKKMPYKESEPDNVTNLKDDRRHKANTQSLHKDKKVNNLINEIIQIDENFDINEFYDGAKKAFEFILKEYSNNNLSTLERLVSKKIFKDFKEQVDERTKSSQSMEITVISVKNPEIKDIKLEKKNIAKIKLSFDSEQVQTLKNKENKIIEGDSNQILSIKEFWTFSKNLKSRDPNWILEEIEESN